MKMWFLWFLVLATTLVTTVMTIGPNARSPSLRIQPIAKQLSTIHEVNTPIENTPLEETRKNPDIQDKVNQMKLPETGNCVTSTQDMDDDPCTKSSGYLGMYCTELCPIGSERGQCKNLKEDKSKVVCHCLIKEISIWLTLDDAYVKYPLAVDRYTVDDGSKPNPHGDYDPCTKSFAYLEMYCIELCPIEREDGKCLCPSEDKNKLRCYCLFTNRYTWMTVSDARHKYPIAVSSIEVKNDNRESKSQTGTTIEAVSTGSKANPHGDYDPCTQSFAHLGMSCIELCPIEREDGKCLCPGEDTTKFRCYCLDTDGCTWMTLDEAHDKYPQVNG